MLQVIRPRGNTGIYIPVIPNSGATYLSEYGNITYKLYGIGVIFPPAGIDDAYTLNGSIRTTPSRYLEGENDCDHLNFHGSIFPISGLTIQNGVFYWGRRTIASSDEPYLNVVVGSSSWNISDIVSYNMDYGRYDLFQSCGSTGELSVWREYADVVRYWNGRTFIAQARSSGSYASGKYTYPTYFEAWIRIIEFSPYRGQRMVNVETRKVHYGMLSSIASLEAIMMSYDRPAYYPSGAYNLNWATIVASFTQPKSYPDFSTILSDFVDNINEFMPRLRWGADVDYSELCYQAVTQMVKWDSNGLALSKELLGLREEVTSILQLIRDIENPKTWASAFLSFKYGLRLTINDTKKLLESFKKQDAHLGPAKVSSSTSFLKNKCDCDVHYAIYFERSDRLFDELYVGLQQFDLFPNSSNDWDLIPFSFVVDWFVNIGGLLERVDSIATLGSRKIVCDMKGEKLSRTLAPDVLGFSGFAGHVRVVRYTRDTSIMTEMPALHLDLPITQGFDHFIESGALILQKILH